ncbi:hypothetical protein BKA65DRAFT_546807 [Rhexocercosporidium sp. MPI-PUGE-AT-0058]|nr:hypothetical protein BKA65DRAFT_546807 [Rhexocercosporidium sp. MPI-PUGE-AT-0058]
MPMTRQSRSVSKLGFSRSIRNVRVKAEQYRAKFDARETFEPPIFKSIDGEDAVPMDTEMANTDEAGTRTSDLETDMARAIQNSIEDTPKFLARMAPSNAQAPDISKPESQKTVEEEAQRRTANALKASIVNTAMETSTEATEEPAQPAQESEPTPTVLYEDGDENLEDAPAPIVSAVSEMEGVEDSKTLLMLDSTPQPRVESAGEDPAAALKTAMDVPFPADLSDAELL